MPGPLRLKANSRPGSATVTTGVLNQDGPRRPLLRARNLAPTAGPVALPAQLQRQHSGLHSPMRVMSDTRPYTVSGGAAMSIVTSSWSPRAVMAAPGSGETDV